MKTSPTSKTSPPSTVGTTSPRNDFGPQQMLAVLDILSRQQQGQQARLSSLTHLGRGGAA